MNETAAAAAPPEWPLNAYRCPRDRAALLSGDSALLCPHCSTSYPIVDGVPVLINDANSVFAIDDYVSGAGYRGPSYGRSANKASGLRHIYRRRVRALREAPSSIRHLGWRDALQIVAATVTEPRMLIVGSGGADCRHPGARVLHTDVAFGAHVQAIADAHDLPLADGSFDLIIAIAVLEHVADPQRCVAEFQRVLKPAGCVYAVTPFLQPVHMGAHDFTRFTLLGHRRLFRWFDTIEAGVSTGVGSVASDALEFLVKSLSSRPVARRLAGFGSLIWRVPLRKLDRWLSAPASIDGAGATYFFGRLRTEPVPDRLLIREYRGGFPGAVTQP